MAHVVATSKAPETQSRPTPSIYRLPTTLIRINCGCGYRSESVSEAQRHVVETGHIVHILGQITPSSRE